MRILLLATMMIFASSAFAGLYKWVDDDGNVHYSQKRPANQQFKTLKAPPAPENNKPLYNSTLKQTKGDNTARSETANNKEIRDENCAIAKKNLKVHQIYRRIKDKDGKLKVVNDDERAENIKQAQQAISEFCD